MVDWSLQHQGVLTTHTTHRHTQPGKPDSCLLLAEAAREDVRRAAGKAGSREVHSQVGSGALSSTPPARGRMEGEGWRGGAGEDHREGCGRAKERPWAVSARISPHPRLTRSHLQGRVYTNMTGVPVPSQTASAGARSVASPPPPYESLVSLVLPHLCLQLLHARDRGAGRLLQRGSMALVLWHRQPLGPNPGCTLHLSSSGAVCPRAGCFTSLSFLACI